MDVRKIALLAFTAVTFLTALAVLGAALGWFPNAHPELVTWGLPTILAEIATTVVIFVKTPLQANQTNQTIRVNLGFQGPPPDLDNQGTYEVLNNGGIVLKKGSVIPILGPGGYQVTLPGDLGPTESIALAFTERAGSNSWAVRPFLPYVQTQAVIRS